MKIKNPIALWIMILSAFFISSCSSDWEDAEIIAITESSQQTESNSSVVAMIDRGDISGALELIFTLSSINGISLRQQVEISAKGKLRVTDEELVRLDVIRETPTTNQYSFSGSEIAVVFDGPTTLYGNNLNCRIYCFYNGILGIDEANVICDGYFLNGGKFPTIKIFATHQYKVGVDGVTTGISYMDTYMCEIEEHRERVHIIKLSTIK